RNQPPLPALHAQLARTRRRERGLARSAHDLLQLAAAADRDPAARARAIQQAPDGIEPRSVGPARTAELVARAADAAGGRPDRARRADPRESLAAHRLPVEGPLRALR